MRTRGAGPLVPVATVVFRDLRCDRGLSLRCEATYCTVCALTHTRVRDQVPLQEVTILIPRTKEPNGCALGMVKVM